MQDAMTHPPGFEAALLSLLVLQVQSASMVQYCGDFEFTHETSDITLLDDLRTAALHSLCKREIVDAAMAVVPGKMKKATHRDTSNTSPDHQ